MQIASNALTQREAIESCPVQPEPVSDSRDLKLVALAQEQGFSRKEGQCLTSPSHQVFLPHFPAVAQKNM